MVEFIAAAVIVVVVARVKMVVLVNQLKELLLLSGSMSIPL